MPIDLYFSSLSPPSRAVLATAQYLGVDVNIKEVDLFAGATHAPEYLKINPNHSVPALVDNGLSLFESRAIMQYLANKYAPNSALYPSSAEARAQVDKILFFDASSYYANMAAAFVPVLIFKQEASQQALDNFKEKIGVLETLLGDRPFFAGDTVTLADISIAASVPIVKLLFASMWTEKLDQWYERTLKAVPQLAKLNDQINKN